MVINSAKYKITNLPRVYVAGVLLEYVERYKYLGMIIHVRNDDYDITRQLRSIILRTNMLLRTFSRCSIEVKLHLFQSYCTNLYCSHVWHIYTKTQHIKLHITYNNALRRLFNLHPRCSASAMFAYSHICLRWMKFVGSICTGLYKDLIAHIIQSCCVPCHLEHVDILYLEAVVPMFISV